MRRLLFCLLAAVVPAGAAVFRYDQSPGTTTGWVTAVNLPDDLPEIRGLLIVGNGAGADETGAVNDPELVAFARSIGFGVMGLGRWSNLYSTTERTRFLAALASFAAQSGRPEVVNVPWIAFGFSQGGGQAYSLNYHFPARTIAIGVNKAGYSFLNGGSDTARLDEANGSRPASPGAVNTPALFVAGQNDDPGRLTNISTAFANNRTLGAPWAWLIEAGVGHEKGAATRWFLPFFEAIAPLRYPANLSAAAGPPALVPVTPGDGWLIDQPSQASGLLLVDPQAAFSGDPLARGWVPDERTARLAQAFGSFDRAGVLGAATTLASPLIAPATLTYSANLSASPGWTLVEFFDGSGKLGERAPSAEPVWTRSLATTGGFVSTYAIVTRSDASRRFTPLQTVWVNGGSGFSMVPGAPEAVWTHRSTSDASGTITGSWGNATNWSTGTVPGGQNVRANFATIDFGATSEILLDGPRTAGYLQFGDAAGGQWTALRPGTNGTLTMNVSSGAAVIQLAPGASQTLHFNGVSPSGTVPLELIGNGDPGQPNMIILALASSYAGPVTLRNAIEWHVPSTGSFGTVGNGTTVQRGSVLNFREWMASGTIAEPLVVGGLGVTGRPALRIGAAANATVTLSGNLTLDGPVALGVAATVGNGTTLVLANRVHATGTDRTLYLGLLRSRSGDSVLPAWGLDTTGLDDAAAATSWGAVVIGANATYGTPPDRVVQGLGTLRLEGAANRLPATVHLVLHGATASVSNTLNASRVVVAGISQEVGGLDSVTGNATRLAIVGGAAATATLVVNTANASSFAGSLGGNGTNENNLALEKRGAGNLTLAGNLTYSGGTRVVSGRLVLSGVASLPATGNVTVEGSGVVVSVSGLTVPGGTTLRRATAGLAAPLQAAGTLGLAGQTTVDLAGYTPSAGDAIPLLSAGAISGNLSALVLPARTSSGPAFRLETSGGAVTLRVDGTTFDAALFRAGLLSSTAALDPSLASADPDADGLANIVEYALGTALAVSQALPMAAEVVGDRLRLTFPRDTKTRDVRIAVEAASAPGGPWTVIAQSDRGDGWSGAAVVTETAADGSGISRVTAADVVSGAPRFLRLRVTYLP